MIHSRSRSLRTQKMLGEGAVEFFAEGEAPCVVAFHGFGGTAAELRPLLEHIARARFAVQAALLPGHGTRVEQLQEMTFEAWVEAGRRHARAAASKYRRVVLLGFSLGSLVAMELAAERFEGLVGLVVLSNALTLSPTLRVSLGLLARLGRWVPDLYVIKPRAGDLVDKDAMRSLVTYDRHPLRAAVEVHRAGARVRDVVARIACPTLVLHGRYDIVCPWQNAMWLSNRVGAQDVTVRIFDKSAHLVACDGEREEVASEVVSFVRRIAPSITESSCGSSSPPAQGAGAP
jgi:carboxylesterase